MFDLIRKIWQTKTVTKTNLLEEAPSCFRGKPIFLSNDCTGCEACVNSCPTGAIDFHKTANSITLSLSYANCIFCGICAELCETKMIQATNKYRLATKDKSNLVSTVTCTTKTPVLVPTEE